MGWGTDLRTETEHLHCPLLLPYTLRSGSFVNEWSSILLPSPLCCSSQHTRPHTCPAVTCALLRATNTHAACLPLLVRCCAQVGPNDHAICALSGGVDSTVAATLVHKVMGNRLHCVFVDHGLLRYKVGNEAEHFTTITRVHGQCLFKFSKLFF